MLFDMFIISEEYSLICWSNKIVIMLLLTISSHVSYLSSPSKILRLFPQQNPYRKTCGVFACHTFADLPDNKFLSIPSHFVRSKIKNIKSMIKSLICRNISNCVNRIYSPQSLTKSTNLLKARSYSLKMDAKLAAIPLVDIDDEGRFKYILIKVYGPAQADGTEPSKLIVRGFKRAQWHGKQFDEFSKFSGVRHFNARKTFFCSRYL